MIKKIFALVVISACQVVSADAPDSFSKAKKVLQEIYSDNRVTFYCNCEFDEKGVIDPETCGYEPRKHVYNDGKINWEHVVPASVFGRLLPCWEQGGRKNCQKTSSVFRSMEADMHNLVPSIGELNSDRANFKFGEIKGEPRNYGRCDFEVDFKRQIVEPKNNIRGDIARIYLYMNDLAVESIGRGFLTKEQKKMYSKWHKNDPPVGWECEKDGIVMDIQGNGNPYLSGC